MKKPLSYLPLLLTAAAILLTAGIYRMRNEPRPALAPETVSSGYKDHSGLLDINTASEAQLQALPGIGPTLSRRIIEYRDENGPFHSIADLMQVEGLGQGKLEAILEMITVGGSL